MCNRISVLVYIVDSSHSTQTLRETDAWSHGFETRAQPTSYIHFLNHLLKRDVTTTPVTIKGKYLKCLQNKFRIGVIL